MIKAIAITLLLASVAGAGKYETLHHARLGRVTASVPWTPAEIPTKLWLDSASASTLWSDTNATTQATNGGAVARWDDKSGNGNHALAVSTNSPTLTAGSYVQGSRDNKMFFANEVLAGQTNGSVFIVGAQVSAQSAWGHWSALDLSANASHTPFNTTAVYDTFMSTLRRNANAAATSLQTPVIWSFVQTGSRLEFWQNGTRFLDSATTFDPPAATNQCLFSSPTTVTGTTAFRISEIVFPDGVLSASDRQKIEGHLADKWWRKKDLDVPLATNHLYYATPPYKE